MKFYKTLGMVLICMLLVSGCVSSNSSTEKPYSGEANIAQEYIAKGESLEKKELLPSALEQYKLALTIDPGNRKAAEHKKNLLPRLWEKAQLHYKKGLQYDKQGKYSLARKEYLSALVNWPDYKDAKTKLSPGKVSAGNAYIIHKLIKGESVSKLGMIYYGDFKKYPIIGKFNHLKDVTKVRIGDNLKIPVIQGVSLLELKRRQENYLNSKNARKAAIKKSAKNIKTKTTEADNKPDMNLESANTIPEQKQNYKSDNMQETIPSSENKKVFELEKQDMKEAEKTLKSSIKTPTPEQPAMENAVEKNSEMAKPEIKSLQIKNKVKKISKPDNYNQAIALFKQKQYPKAIALFSKVETTNQNDKNLSDYLFKSYFQLGLSQFNLKAYLKAKNSFESALKYNKQCENCQSYIEKCMATYKEKHYNLGIQYFSKEQLSKAIEEWDLVKKVDPDYKKVTPNLKKARMLFKRLENIKQSNTK